MVNSTFVVVICTVGLLRSMQLKSPKNWHKTLQVALATCFSKTQPGDDASRGNWASHRAEVYSDVRRRRSLVWEARNTNDYAMAMSRRSQLRCERKRLSASG
jgi:hypothetical protein